MRAIPTLLTTLLLSGASARLPARAAEAPSPPALQVAPSRALPFPVAAGVERLKPALAGRKGGGAYLAWAERTGEQTAVYCSSTRDGLSYTPPVRLSTPGMDLDLGAESGPQVAAGPDGAVYVTWVAGSWKVPSPAPRPKAAARSGAGGHGSMPARPGNLDIFLAASNDDGRTFGAPVRVNDDPEGAEHRFPTVCVDTRGAVYLAWLDKRKQDAEHPDFSRVFFARSTDHGTSFSRNVDATAGQPNGICHCCRIALALQPSGAISVAFRNDVEDMRDTFLAVSRDGGTSFSPPAPIESFRWMINACPFNGPSLGVDAAGRLHGAWMNGGKVPGTPAVGPSTGGGFRVLYRTWGATGAAGPVRLLAEGAHPRVAVRPTGTAFVAWENEGVQLARIESGASGRVAGTRVSPAAASAAFPSLVVKADGEVLVAWQQRGPDDRWQIRTAIVRDGPPARRAARAR